MDNTFQMVAKTFQGLEDVLSDELIALGAKNVEIGLRMVSFEGDNEIMYKANLCCRTALRILKPIVKFTAANTDELYDCVRDFDWEQLLTPDSTFCVDSTVNSSEFTHSKFVTYRVKDGIADHFNDKYGRRPSIRLNGADVILNVHIFEDRVTISLDSSGEPLCKRGYRLEQTDAPINEVLAAGIILKTGWRGDCDFADPMCGSGTFLIEAALIAANINPGIYRRGFAFERWKDFDAELFDSLYNDDSGEREVKFKIYGADISPKAVKIATENIKSAGVGKYIDLQCRAISTWTEAPQPAGVLVTNPPYGERISAPDMDALYQTIGSKLKHVFTGYHAWIIGYRDEYFARIGLAPSQKIPLYNGALECSLREYVIFEGDRKGFVRAGGKIGHGPAERAASDRRSDRKGGFSRSGDRFADRRNEQRGRFADRKDDTRGRFGGRPGAEPEPDPENPLAKRRNPQALKMLVGKQPSLKPQEGPIMRSRGWKKKS